jgi:hypothetical protein
MSLTAASARSPLNSNSNSNNNHTGLTHPSYDSVATSRRLSSPTSGEESMAALNQGTNLWDSARFFGRLGAAGVTPTTPTMSRNSSSTTVSGGGDAAAAAPDERNYPFTESESQSLLQQPDDQNRGWFQHRHSPF